jgi:hypothetical protein
MIEEYSFGHMLSNGKEYRRDLKIIGGRVQKDWWHEEDRRLDTGDIADILSADPDVLVVGTGPSGNMRVEESIRSALEDRNIRLIAKETAEAVQTFNELFSEGRNVGGAFHLTC